MIKDFKDINPNKKPTKIFAFGGLEEVGKNMYGIEYDDELIIVDCGIKFSSVELLGIDGIVPNFAYAKANQHKIKALVITHGHEDHIGGIPYLLREVSVPVIYAPLMATKLIEKKLHEHHNLNQYKIVSYNDKSEFSTKHFKIDFYRVCHSIPDAFGVCVQTPNGNIVESGDYRFDFNAGNEELDIHKVVEISRRGIDLFMTETTNAEIPGFSSSEKEIYDNIKNIIKNANGRVILSTFASNVTRISEVIQIAIQHGRKICLLGKSMDNNVSISRDVGYINLKDDDIVESRYVEQHPDNEIMIFCTGSQGEELAALNMLASGRHPWIQLKKTDSIIMSSNPIPGNYAAVERLLNELSKEEGISIYENSPTLKLHASGHATMQEIQLMLSLLRPKYLFPIHGEYKMFTSLKRIAKKCGFDPENVALHKNGQIVYLIDRELYYTKETIDAEPLFIEGKSVSPNVKRIMNTRQVLSEEGIFAITVVIDKATKQIKTLPKLKSSGCFYLKESHGLMTKIAYEIKTNANEYLAKNQNYSEHELKKIIHESCRFYIWRNKHRNPLVVSNIREI